MRDMTLIADLARAGLDPDLIGRVVNEITTSMSGTNVRDSIRTYETLRKRNQRKSGGKQTMSAPIEPTEVPDSVPDTAAASSLTSLLSSSAGSPLEDKQESKEEVVAPRPRADRGTRIPPDWTLSPENTTLAIEHGHTPQEFETEFKDFWVGVPGTRGRKCDWEATARNRIKETSKRRRVNGNGIGRPNANGITGTVAGDRARELAQLAREREIEAGIRRPDDPF